MDFNVDFRGVSQFRGFEVNPPFQKILWKGISQELSHRITKKYFSCRVFSF